MTAKPFRGRPIQTSEHAASISDLASDRFKIVAVKPGNWFYSIPADQVAELQAAREAGLIITVQGMPRGQVTLYAKLAA